MNRRGRRDRGRGGGAGAEPRPRPRRPLEEEGGGAGRPRPRPALPPARPAASALAQANLAGVPQARGQRSGPVGVPGGVWDGRPGRPLVPPAQPSSRLPEGSPGKDLLSHADRLQDWGSKARWCARGHLISSPSGLSERSPALATNISPAPMRGQSEGPTWKACPPEERNFWGDGPLEPMATPAPAGPGRKLRAFRESLGLVGSGVQGPRSTAV